MGKILIGNEKVHSLFRVYGKDEGTLSKALGFILAENSWVAKEILKIIGVKSIKNLDEKHNSNNFDPENARK